ncbi:hypothetical protein TNCT_417111, partial [Trichonephila clavata]
PQRTPLLFLGDTKGILDVLVQMPIIFIIPVVKRCDTLYDAPALNSAVIYHIVFLLLQRTLRIARLSLCSLTDRKDNSPYHLKPFLLNCQFSKHRRYC